MPTHRSRYSAQPNAVTGDLGQVEFQAATKITTRALSRQHSLELAFAGDGTNADILLSVPTHDAEAIEALRGEADSVALRIRYSNPDAQARLRPTTPEAIEAWTAMEEARCESCGGEVLLGVRRNLVTRLETLYRKRGYAHIERKEDAPLPEALRMMAMQRLMGIEPPKSGEKILEFWQKDIEAKAGGSLNELAAALNDPTAFAGIARQILADLEIEPLCETDTEDADQDQDVDGNEHDREEQQHDSLPDESSGEAEIPPDESLEFGGEQAPSVPMDKDQADEQDSQGTEQESDEAAGPQDQQPLIMMTGNFPYKIFTNRFDQIAHAGELADSSELGHLRLQLDQSLENFQSIVTRLANRLQRQLMAEQLRSWQFDLDEGILDPARLDRIIVTPNVALSYKQEKEIEFRDTIVTLLIDNSGSMRGRPITIAAMCADMLARTLERCGVKVEILGFTTKEWKGGQSRNDWIARGKPESPGRLNDLLHIVYKSADAPWRRTRNNLGLMLREGLLKENIDGEALLWAHERLLHRREDRRILMVISDGAPVDDSTLSMNAGSYLEAHLRAAIKEIETQNDVDLLAIGIGHDVTRYYRRAITIVDAEELGGAIINELATLFARNRRSAKKATARHLVA